MNDLLSKRSSCVVCHCCVFHTLPLVSSVDSCAHTQSAKTKASPKGHVQTATSCKAPSQCSLFLCANFTVPRCHCWCGQTKFSVGEREGPRLSRLSLLPPLLMETSLVKGGNLNGIFHSELWRVSALSAKAKIGIQISWLCPAIFFLFL